MADSFEFFGTKSEYEDYKRKNNVVEDIKNPEEQTVVVQQNAFQVISYENAKKIDDTVLNMLRRTRHHHDPQTVYMQSDVSFYDVFYTSSEETIIDDKELLEQARAIRRIYKSYPAYLYAMNIRDMYMEALEEKIGNDLLFSVFTKSGDAKVWIPPVPIYSKRAEDYENGQYGIIDTSEAFDWDDDLIIEIKNTLSEDKNISSAKDVSVTYGVATDNLTIINSDYPEDNAARSHKGVTSVNLADMDELRKIFKGWYQDDTAKESKKLSEEEALKKRAFSKTPERIERDYYLSQLPVLSRSLSDIMNDVALPSKYNPNEMVVDDKSGKPMTRKEHEVRTVFRLLKDAGWDNELKLMHLLGVGSSREYSILKTKQSKKKRRSNKKITTYADSSDDTGMYGDKNVENLEIFSDLDSLKAQIFPD